MPGGVEGKQAASSVGSWARLMALAAVGGTLLAVVSGAAGWGTAHHLLAALALPPLTALLLIAWIAARPLLPTAAAAWLLFGLAALLTASTVHLVVASAAFAATVLLCREVFAASTGRRR